MSNQINEGAARYNDNTSSHSREGEITEGNSNLPVPSDNRETRNCRSREDGANSTCHSREGGNPLPIVDHLDLWTSTVTPKSTSGRGRGSGKSSKLELTGIKKLRELILELAVRGKLVAQNPDDEPASKLLELIEAEKAQLIKDGKLKKQKPLAPISEDEKPFKLPGGWKWIRFGQVIDFQGGSQPPKSKFIDRMEPGYIQLIQIRDLGPKPQPVFVPESSVSKLCNETDILIGRYGASVGKVFWGKKGAYNVALIKLIFDQEKVDRRYIFTLMISPMGQALFGGISRSAQDGFSKADIETQLLTLPPLAEQQRIVAKVDELMALCDQLEQQSEHQLTAHQQLTDTLLGTLLQPAAGALTESADATTKSSQKEQLNDNWQRLANHFDLLFSGPMGAWAIDRLKDTILQLAVMGKLVPQNPDDEPATKLLEHIEEEKAQLVKEGKIKKPKKLPPVSDEEKPFELPSGWEWSRLPEIGELARGKSKHRPRNDPKLYEEGKYPLIQTGDVARSNGSISTYGATYNDFGLEQSRLWPAQTLCITIAANIADTGLLEFDACFPDSVVGFNGFLGVSNRFYEFFVRTYKEKLAEFAPSTAQKNINLEILSSMLIPVSPLPEQQRIVEKVDELFALCDQLQDRLQKASETEQHLTNAIVEQALG